MKKLLSFVFVTALLAFQGAFATWKYKTSDWMRDIPNEIKLSELTLVSAHDAGMSHWSKGYPIVEGSDAQHSAPPLFSSFLDELSSSPSRDSVLTNSVEVVTEPSDPEVEPDEEELLRGEIREGFFSNLWNGVKKVFKKGFELIKSGFKFVWDHVAKPIIEAVVTPIWDHVLKPFLKLIFDGLLEKVINALQCLYAKTQYLDVGELLGCGVRYFDLRPRVSPSGGLIAYHGQDHFGAYGQPLPEIARQIRAFLTSHPTETLILQVGHFYGKAGESEHDALIANFEPGFVDLISDLLYKADTEETANAKNLNELTMGELRGKCLLLTSYDNRSAIKGMWGYDSYGLKKDEKQNDVIKFTVDSKKLGQYTLFDDYAGTCEVEACQKDQIHKWEMWNNQFRSEDIAFLLSWTLTPQIQDVGSSLKDIAINLLTWKVSLLSGSMQDNIQKLCDRIKGVCTLAIQINPYLSQVLSDAQQKGWKKPNLVNLDFITEGLARTVIDLNAKIATGAVATISQGSKSVDLRTSADLGAYLATNTVWGAENPVVLTVNRDFTLTNDLQFIGLPAAVDTVRVNLAGCRLIGDGSHGIVTSNRVLYVDSDKRAAKVDPGEFGPNIEVSSGLKVDEGLAIKFSGSVTVGAPVYTETGDPDRLIKGGLFAKYVPEALIADGFKCTHNTDKGTVEDYPFMVAPFSAIGTYNTNDVVAVYDGGEFTNLVEAIEFASAVHLGSGSNEPLILMKSVDELVVPKDHAVIVTKCKSESVNPDIGSIVVETNAVLTLKGNNERNKNQRLEVNTSIVNHGLLAIDECYVVATVNNAEGGRILVSSGFLSRSTGVTENQATNEFLRAGSTMSPGIEGYRYYRHDVARIISPYGSIVSEGYSTVQAAIKAADGENGQYVELVADAGECIVIPEDKCVNLDLNGHKLDGGGEDNVIKVFGAFVLSGNDGLIAEVKGKGIYVFRNGSVVMSAGALEMPVTFDKDKNPQFVVDGGYFSDAAWESIGKKRLRTVKYVAVPSGDKAYPWQVIEVEAARTEKDGYEFKYTSLQDCIRSALEYASYDYDLNVGILRDNDENINFEPHGGWIRFDAGDFEIKGDLKFVKSPQGLLIGTRESHVELLSGRYSGRFDIGKDDDSDTCELKISGGRFSVKAYRSLLRDDGFGYKPEMSLGQGKAFSYRPEEDAEYPWICESKVAVRDAHKTYSTLAEAIAEWLKTSPLDSMDIGLLDNVDEPLDISVDWPYDPDCEPYKRVSIYLNGHAWTAGSESNLLHKSGVSVHIEDGSRLRLGRVKGRLVSDDNENFKIGLACGYYSEWDDVNVGRSNSAIWNDTCLVLTGDSEYPYLVAPVVAEINVANSNWPKKFFRLNDAFTFAATNPVRDVIKLQCSTAEYATFEHTNGLAVLDLNGCDYYGKLTNWGDLIITNSESCLSVIQNITTRGKLELRGKCGYAGRIDCVFGNVEVYDGLFSTFAAESLVPIIGEKGFTANTDAETSLDFPWRRRSESNSSVKNEWMMPEGSELHVKNGILVQIADDFADKTPEGVGAYYDLIMTNRDAMAAGQARFITKKVSQFGISDDRYWKVYYEINTNAVGYVHPDTAMMHFATNSIHYVDSDPEDVAIIPPGMVTPGLYYRIDATDSLDQNAVWTKGVSALARENDPLVLVFHSPTNGVGFFKMVQTISKDE